MVRIVTDSASDISVEEAKELGVDVIALGITFGDETFREGVDLSTEEFYKKLAESPQLPKTSQPSLEDFIPIYTEAKEAGDGVVVILLSSKLSGTCQTAMIAHELAGGDVYVVDSKSIALGERMLVDLAIKLRSQGLSAGEIAVKLNDAAGRTHFLALVATLEYIYRGGRLSRTAKIAGTLLGFKPIISLENGEVKIAGKERGVKRGLAAILNIMTELPSPVADMPLYFGFTETRDKCDMLRKIVLEKFTGFSEHISSVGSAIGTHAGPGACAVSFISEE